MDQLFSLSVVVPTYNEEKTLPTILKRILLQKEVTEVVIVDDASTDNSKRKIKNLITELKTDKIKYIRQEKNQGKGAAIQVGINNATGDLLLIQDADLEYHPEDYPKLIKAFRKNPDSFVIGNRWPSNKGYLLCQFGNWLITRVVNFLFWIDSNDPYTCYKVGSTEIWRQMNLTSNGFEIEGEIIAKLALMRVPLVEVPIQYSPRTYSEGKKIRAKDVFVAMHTLFSIRLQHLFTFQFNLGLLDGAMWAQSLVVSSANTTKRCQSVPKGQQV